MIRAVVFGSSKANHSSYEYYLWLRRGTCYEWEKFNPILFENEPSIDTTNNQIRIGDGITRWTGLPVATPEDALNLLLGARPNA